MFDIFKNWLPLALSWFFMAMELPFTTSVIARLSDPEHNLASFGGIAFPLAMLIEAPIIMLLSASTALCVDYDSYKKVYRFMMWAGGCLTLFHIILTATPLYGIIIRDIVGAPEELHGFIRIALYCLIPWTWSIAHRRFHQGILIRFGRAKSVSVGTFCRVMAISLVLSCGFIFSDIPGAAIAALAASAGVVAEAIFISIRVQPIVKGPLFNAPQAREPLTTKSFFVFYIPLALTSVLGFLTQPIGSASITRMPLALESLAVWPVVSSFTFLFRCWGHAFQEITVARFDIPGQRSKLFSFMLLISFFTSVPFLLISLSSLHMYIFQSAYGLTPSLSVLAGGALLYCVGMPVLSPIASYYQGILLVARRTRHITEAIIIFLIITSVVLLWGIQSQRYPALHITVAALTVGAFAQCCWLILCANRAIKAQQRF